MDQLMRIPRNSSGISGEETYIYPGWNENELISNEECEVFKIHFVLNLFECRRIPTRQINFRHDSKAKLQSNHLV